MNPSVKTFSAVALLTVLAGSWGCQQKTAEVSPWTPQDNWRINAPQPYPRTLSEKPAYEASPSDEVPGQGHRSAAVRKQYTFDDP